MGELAPRLGQPTELYRGLRAEALATLVYIGTRVQALSAATRPLEVTSSVRDDAYQELLRAGNPEAAQGYSLHTTGYAFDIRRRYESGAQAQAFQFLLDDLTARNLIAWVREPAAIHVTVAPDAESPRPARTRLEPHESRESASSPRSRSRRPPSRHSGGTRYSKLPPARSAFSASCCRISWSRGLVREAEPTADARRPTAARSTPSSPRRRPREDATSRARGRRSARAVWLPRRLVLECQPVQVEADLRRQIRALASDLGDAVRMLHRADEVARLVAVDLHRLLRDPRGLAGEALDRLETRAPVERVPAGAALDEPDRQAEGADDAEPDEELTDRRERRQRCSGSNAGSSGSSRAFSASAMSSSISSALSPEYGIQTSCAAPAHEDEVVGLARRTRTGRDRRPAACGPAAARSSRGERR